MTRNLLITTVVIGIFLATFASPTHARTELRCKRFLFFEFSCQEVEVDYALTKKIRLSGEDEFNNKLDPVLNTQEMVFRIEIKNNGDATDDKLKILDTLPQNLTFVSSENMAAEDRKVRTEIDEEIQSNETTAFTYVAQANLEGISQGEKRCVTNNAVLYRDENDDDEAQDAEIEASDNSTICILNGTPRADNGFGDVNGDTDTDNENATDTPDQLPDSAAGGLGIILSSLGTLSGGLYLSRRINF